MIAKTIMCQIVQTLNPKPQFSLVRIMQILVLCDILKKAAHFDFYHKFVQGINMMKRIIIHFNLLILDNHYITSNSFFCIFSVNYRVISLNFDFYSSFYIPKNKVYMKSHMLISVLKRGVLDTQTRRCNTLWMQ